MFANLSTLAFHVVCSQAAGVKQLLEERHTTPHSCSQSQPPPGADWINSARLFVLVHIMTTAVGAILRLYPELSRMTASAVLQWVTHAVGAPQQHIHEIGVGCGVAVISAMTVGEVVRMLDAAAAKPTMMAPSDKQNGKNDVSMQQPQSRHSSINWLQVQLLMLSAAAAVMAAVACLNWALGYVSCLVLLPLSVAGTASLAVADSSSKVGATVQQVNSKRMLGRLLEAVILALCSPPVVLMLMYAVSGYPPLQVFSMSSIWWLLLESRFTCYVMFWVVYLPFWSLTLLISLSE